jgi:hypothetical protein
VSRFNGVVLMSESVRTRSKQSETGRLNTQVERKSFERYPN